MQNICVNTWASGLEEGIMGEHLCEIILYLGE